jgi:uncharacterized GH25 family protein
MPRFRTWLAVGMLFVVPVAACPAHDLKVMSDRLTVERGEQATISISWGHLLPLDAPIDAGSLSRYDLRSPSESVAPLEKQGVSMQSNEVQLEEEGVYQAVAVRKPSIFTVVVDENGRHRHHRGPKTSVDPKAGTIDHAALSRQYARTLIVSGSPQEEPVAASGLPLEIVPLEAPAAWRGGRDLRFQVLFEGRPVAGEDLVVSVVGVQPTADAEADTDTDAGAPKSPTVTTDEKGVATVSDTQPGVWVLRLRLRRPTADERTREEYDFESHTATLVLEIRP